MPKMNWGGVLAIWRSWTMTLRRIRLRTKVMTEARRGEMQPLAGRSTTLDRIALIDSAAR
jgi:hypothetical protein